LNSEDLFKLYEKQYYHEIDVRDKLNSRLQVPLVVLVTILGFMGYMLQNKSPNISGNGVVLFWVCFSVSAASIISSLVFFRKSWFGHTDKLLPTAQETEHYKEELMVFYESYDDCKILVEKALKKYLYNSYVTFSSINTINNDSRSYNLYKMTVALTLATVFSFLSFIPYHFNGLDKANHSKPFKVEIIGNIKNKTHTESLIMADDTTPPIPPTPPSPRSVKGSVPKPAPTPEPKIPVE